MRVGIIVEGTTDTPVFEELIPKIEPQVARVVIRPALNKSRLLAVFPELLWDFQFVEPGGPADKVLVIRDSNSDDPGEVEKAMRQRLEGRRYPPFRRGLEFHAIRRETETWLLADVEAINRVAVANGGLRVDAIPGPLEQIPNAKERFGRLLARAGLPRVPEIVRQITREADLAEIRLQCPGFREFETKVRR